jgi:hypothetical protein
MFRVIIPKLSFLFQLKIGGSLIPRKNK